MLTFTNEQIATAKEMHDLGIEWSPEPGSFIFTTDETLLKRKTPFQEGVYLLHDIEEFIEDAGGRDEFFKKCIWLPVWEDGCHWLREHRVPNKHLYYVIKEGVMFYDEDERWLLYQEILRIVKIDGEIASE